MVWFEVERPVDANFAGLALIAKAQKAWFFCFAETALIIDYAAHARKRELLQTQGCEITAYPR